MPQDGSGRVFEYWRLSGRGGDFASFSGVRGLALLAGSGRAFDPARREPLCVLALDRQPLDFLTPSHRADCLWLAGSRPERRATEPSRPLNSVPTARLPSKGIFLHAFAPGAKSLR